MMVAGFDAQLQERIQYVCGHDAMSVELDAPLPDGILVEGHRRCRVTEQRGGVHSDPMMRMIAARSLERRDVDWWIPVLCACGHYSADHSPRSREHGDTSTRRCVTL